jgi:uracil phosphoribosyltransferase
MTNNLHILDHPLATHKLAILRDKDTPSALFRTTLAQLSWLLAYPAFAALKIVPHEIDTPLEPMMTASLPNPAPCLVSILRAGNGLVDGFSQLCPEASIAHLGLYRDEDTLQPVSYYTSVPQDIAKRQVILADPMLATGGSAILGMEKLVEMGVRDIVFACLVAAPEGVTALHDAFPDLPIFAGCLDRELNDKGYILPGLGDAGDRIYDT